MSFNKSTQVCFLLLHICLIHFIVGAIIELKMFEWTSTIIGAGSLLLLSLFVQKCAITHVNKTEDNSESAKLGSGWYSN
jgi:hypothetical protein